MQQSPDFNWVISVLVRDSNGDSKGQDSPRQGWCVGNDEIEVGCYVVRVSSKGAQVSSDLK